MEIRQFVTEALGDASYLVVDGGVAAVVDPQRDIRPFVAAAEARNARIEYVFETHVHNDHLSGGRELAALGAKVVAPRDGALQFPHLGIGNGDDVMVGGVTLRAVSAPGHTYEHTAYLALDEQKAARGAFTGGALLMAAAGRSDLLGPDHTEELLRLQWETAHRLRDLLPADASIMPTHGEGSFCSSAGACTERMGPLSVELGRNPALASPSFATFRAIQTASPAPIPGYYAYMAPLNRQGPKVFGRPPAPSLLQPGAIAALAGSGVHMVDARRRQDFAEAHIPGTIVIEDDGSLLPYLGWLVPFNAPVVLITYDAAQAERLTVDLFRIGYEDVRGYLPFANWTAEDRPTGRLNLVSARDVAATIESGARPVLDVRFAGEQEDLPLPNTLRRPTDRVTAWIADAPDDALVVCASGYRSSIVASILQASGRHVSAVIAGGAAEVLQARVAVS